MSTIERPPGLSEAVECYEATRATSPESFASVDRNRAVQAEQWQSSVESRLIEWGKQGSKVDEDGLVSPSPGIVSVAFRIAAQLRDAGISVPLRMVQDGAGGIVFEWRHETVTEKLRLHASGRIELTRFRDSKLVYRCPVFLG